MVSIEEIVKEENAADNKDRVKAPRQNGLYIKLLQLQCSTTRNSQDKTQRKFNINGLR